MFIKMKSLKIVVLARGCDLSDGLLNGGEAGLLHLRTISQIVGRKIRVWDTAGTVLGIFSQNNCCNKPASKQKLTHGIKLNKNALMPNECSEARKANKTNDHYCWTQKSKLSNESYLELLYEYLEDGKVRHWLTKMNESGLCRLGSAFKNDNNCLFDAICQQCDFEPATLREMTARALRQQNFVVEDVFPQFKGAGALLLGGAKYFGVQVNDARALLDNSQGTRGEGHAAVAHPRGHASYPNGAGYIDSVENYSKDSNKSFPKSGWMSRDEQDESIHRLLQTRESQMAMELLNKGSRREAVVLVPSFEIRVGLWAGGVMFRGPLRAERVTIVLQHHRGQVDEPNADVQVFTCYPMAPRGSENEEMTLPPQLTLKRSHPSSDDEGDDSTKRPKSSD